MQYYQHVTPVPCCTYDVLSFRGALVSLSLVGRTRVSKGGSWTGRPDPRHAILTTIHGHGHAVRRLICRNVSPV